MGFSLYLVFRNPLLKSPKGKRLVTLCLVFTVYLFAGAYVFYTMNKPLETLAIQDWISYRINWTERHQCLSNADLEALAKLVLDAANSGIIFSKSINSTTTTDEYTSNWSFGGETLFFTFTLLTTIGYGHITPLTVAGKLFSIVYLIPGIPLTMIVLTAIVQRLELAVNRQCSSQQNDESGAVGSHPKKLKFKKYDSMCELKIDAASPNDSVVANRATTSVTAKAVYIRTCAVGLVLFVLVYLVPSVVFSTYAEPSWSFLDAVYFCFTSITTIGFVYLFIGIAMNMLFLNLAIRLPIFTRINRILNFKRRKYYELFNENTAQSENNSLSSDTNSHVGTSDSEAEEHDVNSNVNSPQSSSAASSTSTLSGHLGNSTNNIQPRPFTRISSSSSPAAHLITLDHENSHNGGASSSDVDIKSELNSTNVNNSISSSPFHGNKTKSGLLSFKTKRV